MDVADKEVCKLYFQEFDGVDSLRYYCFSAAKPTKIVLNVRKLAIRINACALIVSKLIYYCGDSPQNNFRVALISLIPTSLSRRARCGINVAYSLLFCNPHIYYLLAMPINYTYCALADLHTETKGSTHNTARDH